MVKIAALLCLVFLWSCSTDSLPERQAILNEPFLEWELIYDHAMGNKYDVKAHALFTHESGKQVKSLMYYSGHGNAWKFRFTGTVPGAWTFETKGPGSLGGQEGKVEIQESGACNGFLGAIEHNWIWKGSNRAVVPQLVMLEEPERFWKDNHPDTAAIRATVHEFVVEHGFTGFHLEGGGYWFDISSSALGKKGDPIWPDSLCIPDERTISVYEAFILETYRQGGVCYIWLWRSDNSGSSRAGPELLGGENSLASNRLQKYLAGRFGPLPGWFMGYGFDLDRWVGDYFGDEEGAAARLEEWKDKFKTFLGGWNHMLGGRAHSCVWKDYPENDAYHDSIFWYGDFADFVNFRPAYLSYLKTINAAPGVPCFQGDRFRIRDRERYAPKDYTDHQMVIRGLWHSTMAGGVGNIWGNLTHPDGTFDKGEIKGKPVEVKNQVKTWSEFWTGHNRFLPGMIPDINLTEGKEGAMQLHPEGEEDICVALRDGSYDHIIIYAENAIEIRLNLSSLQKEIKAVAVDTRKSYSETDIGMVEPKDQWWKAPYASDWAIALGNF